ncbi:MAG: hypothetical protein CL911_05655 [Deltaproteobacteria bacterium]|jgi:transposase InsO family protein|nr:hypothetical protein [Deltaproteobacteria bacterium]|tara:strand:- start:1289 stop:2680 length:1392 start_codon:yes stop_codon:yes gene_type:complete
MSNEEKGQQANEVAEFRYSIIAELANPYLSREQRRRLLFEKASVEYEVPRLGRRKLSVGCLRKWLRLYLAYGKEGLLPHSRCDAGIPRSLSSAEAALFLNYLESKPELNSTVVLRILQKQGKILSEPSSSSLSRLVRAAGLERKKRLALKQTEENLKFDFIAPLECLQVDGLYTVAVSDHKGKRKRAILLAFLDDATRRVVFTGFAFSENSLLFERGIRHILMAHGRIGRLYCDNGAAFVSAQTKRILDTLGVIMVHSRVGRPSGRGKIERFFRTVREQFLRPLDVEVLKSLEDLELRFHSWLESEYHRNPHRGLNGKTPLEVWVERANRIIAVDPGIDYIRLFYHEVSRKVHKDSTVTLDGLLYQVPSTLIAQRIHLCYDPHLPVDKRALLIRHQGQDCGVARIVDSYANAKVRRNGLFKQPVVEELNDCPSESTDSPPSPLDAGLSASQIRLQKPESEVQP